MRGLSSSSTVDRVGTYAASGFKHAGSRDTLFAKAPRNPRKIYAARRFSRNGFRVFPTFDTLYDIVDTTLRAPLHCYPCCFGILLFFYSSCARRRLDIISSEFSPLLPLKFTAECSHGNLIEAALISWAFFFFVFSHLGETGGPALARDSLIPASRAGSSCSRCVKFKVQLEFGRVRLPLKRMDGFPGHSAVMRRSTRRGAYRAACQLVAPGGCSLRSTKLSTCREGA